jgi:hypothetical protein
MNPYPIVERLNTIQQVIANSESSIAVIRELTSYVKLPYNLLPYMLMSKI